jgi:formylglycine-generating enzyme required for sulfatase activity
LLPADASVGDTGAPDSTFADTGLADAGLRDAAASDSVAADASSMDAGFADGNASDSGGLSLPPSCALGGPGMTNCGTGDDGTESCCTSIEVEGGTYYRTYGNDGGGPTGEADPASVSSFRLDKYLVTVGRFRQFVTAWDGGSGLDGGPGYEPAAERASTRI